MNKSVINHIKGRILTEKNLEELVKLTNDELRNLYNELSNKLQALEKEAHEITPRLSRLYDALETGKLGLDDIAPRIKVLRTRQEELAKAKV